MQIRNVSQLLFFFLSKCDNFLNSMSKKIENHLFKKIEVWLLYLIVIILIFFGLIFGAIIDYNKRGGEKYLELTSIATKVSSTIVDALRYLQNPLRDKELLKAEVSTKFSKQLPGFNVYKKNEIDLLFLLNITEPSSRKHIIKLVDLKSYKTLYKYSFDYDMFRSVKSVNNEGFASSITDDNTFFRSTYITEKTEIISLFSSNSLVKFKPKENKILWFKDDAMYHHTFFVNEDNGYIWAIGCQHGKNLDDMWVEKQYPRL